MLHDALVIDAVVHAFNFQPDNYGAPFVGDVTKMLYAFSNEQLAPLYDDRYKLSWEQFSKSFRKQPLLLERTLFGESVTDVGVFHGVPMYGLYKDGSSPVWVAQEIAKKYPHRMRIYGDVSPWQPDAIERIDHLVDQVGVIGLKFYPADFISGEVHEFRLDDETIAFPLIEHARSRGLRTIAVHKAVPFGPLPIGPYSVGDVEPAVATFPDVTFEIVHGGFAFAEETAQLLERHQNVTINLETLPCFAVNFADKFAEMLAPLLATGAHDRIFYATGSTSSHPQPAAEAFWNFEMPDGMPPLTEDMKRGMLGENYAKHHGWDVDELMQACADDDYGVNRPLSEPWSELTDSPVGTR